VLTFASTPGVDLILKVGFFFLAAAAWHKVWSPPLPHRYWRDLWLRARKKF
jgi:hypothetical protein